MPRYLPLDFLPSYLPEGNTSKEPRRDFPKEAGKEAVSLESIIVGKTQTFAAILGDIAREIGKRETLSVEVIENIDQHYRYLKTKLYETDLWPLGHNRAIEIRRSKLEQQLDTLLQERRQEQVKCCQDISRLKSEFRTWFKQHSDLEQRASLVLGKKIQESSRQLNTLLPSSKRS